MKRQTSDAKRYVNLPGEAIASLKVLWMLVLGVWCFAATTTSAQEIKPIVSDWLAAQKEIQTFTADLTQTRTLKSLTQPLHSPGKVYFSAPHKFHWELGQPPQTIAVRSGETLEVIYPRLKRAEIYSLTNAGQFRDTMALLDAGFPRSEADLRAQFNVLSQNPTGAICELVLQPKSASARQMMPEIRISFATNNLELRATQLQFADGSTMRNDFTNIVLNPKLDESLFAPKLESDYKIVEPLKR